MRTFTPIAVIATVIAAASVVPAVALADEPAKSTGWSGSGELGLAVASGNTDSQTLVGKVGLSWEDALWKHEVGLAMLYGKQDDIESASRYEAFGNTNRRLGQRSHVFGSVRTVRDHFSAYEYQSTIAFGYGYEAIKSEATHLLFEIGPGYRWSKLQDVRVHENGVIARGYMDFGHQFNASTSIYETLLIEAGQDNTFVRNDLGVQVKMSEALALKAGVEVRHNTDVQPGIEKTDTLTTVNVVYGF